jgi:hypothetical protein
MSDPNRLLCNATTSDIRDRLDDIIATAKQMTRIIDQCDELNPQQADAVRGAIGLAEAEELAGRIAKTLISNALAKKAA